MSKYTNLIVFAIVALLIAGSFRTVSKWKSEIRKFDHVQHTEYSRTGFLIQIALAVIAVIAAAVLYFADLPLKDHQTYALLALVFFAIFMTNVINYDMNHSLYYTNTGFFLKDGYIPIKKAFRVTVDKRGRNVLVMRDEKQYSISAAQAEEIKKLL